MTRQSVTMKVPLSRPSIGEEEIEAVADVLRSGWITSGPRVREFEQQFARHVSCQEAIAVQSCTSALFICLQALHLQPGSEVIIPALTWPSAVAGCLYLGLVPVMADVEWKTLNISPQSATAKLSPRTGAIVPVHFAGLPYDAAAIARIAAETSAPIIDDSAHALGARCAGRPVGQDVLASCYSFHPIKNITTAEGGMIATNNRPFAQKVKKLRLLGVDRDAWRRYGTKSSSAYDITALSLKHNMTDIQAAIGLVQLSKLEKLNARRAALAERYLEKLSGLRGLILPDAGDESCRHAWHLFVVRTQDQTGAYSRDAVVSKLAENNVSTGIHFVALPDLTYYRDRLQLDPADTPNAVAAGRSVLSLPLYPDMRLEEQDIVVSSLYRIFGQ